MRHNKLISLKKIKKINKKKTIAFTNGCFDILHSGHINLLLNSKKKADILIVGVNSDKSYLKNKKKKPRFNFSQRVKILSEINSVDYIIKQTDMTPINLIKHIHPNIHCKGGDYKKSDLKEYELLKSLKIKIYLMPITGSKISSSKIKL